MPPPQLQSSGHIDLCNVDTDEKLRYYVCVTTNNIIDTKASIQSLRKELKDVILEFRKLEGEQDNRINQNEAEVADIQERLKNRDNKIQNKRDEIQKAKDRTTNIIIALIGFGGVVVGAITVILVG